MPRRLERAGSLWTLVTRRGAQSVSQLVTEPAAASITDGNARTGRAWSLSPPRPIPNRPNICEALRRAIERLPAKQRQVVLMHYLEETSVNNVAALLSVTAKTVEGRLYQARRTLRRLLEQSFGVTDWKDAAMSVTLVPEDDLRAALRPYRVDPDDV